MFYYNILISVFCILCCREKPL